MSSRACCMKCELLRNLKVSFAWISLQTSVMQRRDQQEEPTPEMNTILLKLSYLNICLQFLIFQSLMNPAVNPSTATPLVSFSVSSTPTLDRCNHSRACLHSQPDTTLSVLLSHYDIEPAGPVRCAKMANIKVYETSNHENKCLKGTQLTCDVSINLLNYLTFTELFYPS